MALSWLVSNAIGEAIDQLRAGVLVDGEARAHRPTVLIFFRLVVKRHLPSTSQLTHKGKTKFVFPHTCTV